MASELIPLWAGKSRLEFSLLPLSLLRGEGLTNRQAIDKSENCDRQPNDEADACDGGDN